MPEPHDPLDDALGSMLDADDLSPVLTGADVRAVGERRRRRRTVAAGVAAVAAGALVVGTVFALDREDPAPPLPAATSTPPSASATPTPTTSTAAPTSPSPSPTGSPSADSSGRPAPTPSWRTTIPADIPLAAGYPDRDEAGEPVTVQAGPGPGIDLCGQSVLTGSGAEAAASARYLGGEDFRSRTLIVFADDAEARAAVDRTEATVGDCAGSAAGSAVTVLGAVEGQDSFLWSQAFGPEGGPTMATDLVRLVRVGNAVVVDSTGGEAGGPALTPQDAQVVKTREALAPVLDAMQVYAPG